MAQVAEKLGGLHQSVNLLESWLAQAVTSLKREGVDVDPKALKEKIEKLYVQKGMKQKDLDAIKELGKELLDDVSTGDKTALRETLADVQAKWHDLTELLVQMISFAVSRSPSSPSRWVSTEPLQMNS